MSKRIFGVMFAALTFALLSASAQAATYFTGNLNGAQEVPPTASSATGFGRVTLNDAETSITVSVYYSGLGTGVTAGHIHGPAAPGVNAAVIFNLNPMTGVTSGQVVNANFAVTPTQVDQLKSGLWYFNIHTTGFGGGEIRGQITVDSPFLATLNSNQEVPVNNSTATGSGAINLNAAGTQALVTLNFSGLTGNATAGHIHGIASPGVNAPVICNLMPAAATSGSVVDTLCNFTAAQVTALKQGRLYFNVHTSMFPGGEIRGQTLRRRSTVLDYDGDSKTDFVNIRNNAGTNTVEWWISLSSGGSSIVPFGISSDFTTDGIFVSGDFDGDGRSDIAFWRDAAQGFFFIINSSNGTVSQIPFGTTGDDPTVVDDYDGDGRTDPAVYRAGTQSIWFYRASANNPAGNITFVPWGTTGDFPVPGDFSGDGKGDFCVQRGPTPADFWILNSNGTSRVVNDFGTASDLITPGDFDGDGKVDITVTRNQAFAPPQGDGVSRLTWFIRESLHETNLQRTARIVQWGPTTGRQRTQGDYDGDGKADVAVWIQTNPSTYWVLPSNGSPHFAVQWGLLGDFSVNGYNVH